MTLNDIIVASLAQLDRGHDAQSLDVWRDKLTRFANDAVLDLAGAFMLRRTETAPLRHGGIDLNALARPCLKVLAVAQNGKKLGFSFDEAGQTVYPSGADGLEADITYRCAPRPVSSPADVPDVPEWCHGLIVTYVVGRERASGEVNLQRGGNVYFQMYESGKRMIRPHKNDAAAYSLVNRW